MILENILFYDKNIAKKLIYMPSTKNAHFSYSTSNEICHNKIPIICLKFKITNCLSKKHYIAMRKNILYTFEKFWTSAKYFSRRFVIIC